MPAESCLKEVDANSNEGRREFPERRLASGGRGSPSPQTRASEPECRVSLACVMAIRLLSPRRPS